jgi:RNA polymerase sigma factor (sigma-70 family)
MPFESDESPEEITQLLTIARNMARRWCGDPEADDIAQEAMIRLWSLRDPPRNAVTWLAVVTRRLCNRLRMRERSRSRAEGVFAVEQSSMPSASADFLLDVNRILGRLPERDRRLITSVKEGLYTIEIASLFECDARDVGQMVSRARRKARMLRDGRRAPLSEIVRRMSPSCGSRGTCTSHHNNGGRCSNTDPESRKP